MINVKFRRLKNVLLNQISLTFQLFFIGYAQQYCPQTDLQGYNFGAKQSPNEVRLQGTLSNSQIFRSTFNCPVGQLYTPEKPCNVWESSNDNPELNVPKTATQIPDVNVPQNKHNESDAYKQCSDIIESSLDTRVDPCDDFYGYVCRRYEGPGAFYDVIYANQQKLINTLRNDSMDTGKLIAPKFERYWFRKCNDSLTNWDSVTENADYPAKMIAEVEKAFNIKFPLANGNPTTNPTVDAALFGKLIGYINRNYENVYPIFAAFVYSDYKEPETGYRHIVIFVHGFIVELTLKDLIDCTLTLRLWLDSTQTIMKQTGLQTALNAYEWGILMKIYLSAAGSTPVSDNQILAAAMDMVNFEYIIAQNIGPDPDGDDVDAVYNPMTVGDAKTTYAQSLDLASIFEQTAVGVDGLAEKLKDPNYKLIFQTPDNYKITTDNLQTVFDKPGKKVPNDAILNYIFFRLIYARQNYLPGTPAPYFRELYQKPKLPRGAPDVGIKRRPPKFPENDDHPIYAQYDYTRAEFLCSMALGDKFTEINNRLFVESVFPIEPIRNKTRENVAQFAEAIAVSFRAMINQLEWMEPESKKGAYDKLDLFVRNILYPNETFNDDFLDDFYRPLTTTGWDPKKDTSSFVDIQMIMGKFLLQKNLIPLASNKSASRTDFGDTSQVNAFYQPTANSITILSGITQPPFYHLDWPAAVNYGAIGLVVGHEITHGFDNGGVLWDGIGAYKNWMDNTTQEAFNNMTHCIINEYSQFCRNKTNKNELQCIDGDLTQGENIADNGGIQSAYRAYRLHSDFYGEDPALPGKIAGKFTNDQLFFIGFTRTWCEYYYEPTEAYVWDDVHSPGPYRIEGSLRNFDGFRAAFNCPAKSKYSPNPDDEVNPSCKIWISDVTAHLEVPTRAPVPPNLNLPQPQEVTPGNVAYNNVSKYLSTLDVKQSPCDNFYEYACNNIQVTSNAQQINLDVAKTVSAALDSLDVTGAQDFYVPIKQYYDNCVKTLGNVPDGSTVTPFVTEFQTKTGINFPLFGAGDPASLTADQIGTALGYLSGTQAINTFVDVKVLKKFENVNVDPKYILNLGEPVLTQPVDFYLDPAVKAMKDPIQDAFKAVLTGYRKAINKEASVKDDDIATAAEGLYLLELKIATKMRTFADRNNASLAETTKTIGDLATSYPDVNWDKFFTEYGTNALDEVKGYFADKTYTVTVPSPDTLKDILPAILKDPTNQITATHLANYFNFRVIWDLATSLTSVSIDGSGDLPKIDDPKLAQKYVCALETRELAPLHSKLYIDSFNKDATATQNWRETATKIGNGVVSALKAQVQQVEWLSPDIKKKAGDKFDNLTINVLFDNIITKPADLKSAYADYTPPDPAKMSPSTVMAAFRVYVLKTELKLLQSTVTTIDRTAYLGSSSDPLPHYDALTNSLTIPASLATEPYFSDSYPLASNYGGLGYLIAHELAHSFDKLGIQFDALGKLQALLDTTTQAKFDGIATCLSGQYNTTCPLGASYAPNCLDGVRRMDENIADNAGIHAAYSAYLAAANFNGEDPRLADPLLSQYTESQLFFLSYARDLCVKKQTDDQVYANIISGTNPPKYRIQNALQNYPAFQSAFNCPATSKYVLKDRCNVWITDNSGTITQP
ncbi:NEPrilysin metallopeptidase family [Aphelenchoides bicaudatus]|nr:NEPrilysin metallopeptidase family [Aphelenchoides bicaudatus]